MGIKLIPSIKQWKSWSLPSKLTAIGAYAGVIALFLFLVEKAYFFSSNLNKNESSANFSKEKIVDTNILKGKIRFAENLCEKSNEYKNKRVEIKLLNMNVEPMEFNACGDFVFKDIKGYKGQIISYQAKSGNLQDDGSLILWNDSNNLVLLK